MKNASSVDEYIAGFPESVAKKLREIRALILSNVPEVAENISYGMPAYKTFKKPLVYFGGYPNHIGFYATPSGHQKFEKELSGFKQGKGSVQFPIEQPLPIQLIREMILFRKEENITKYSPQK